MKTVTGFLRRYRPQLSGMAIALIAFVALLLFGLVGLALVLVIGLLAEVRYRARHRTRVE